MEDSDIFADMMQEFLSGEGYNVKRAVNGFDGIKQVYSFMPHIVITDIEMPLFKGYQVARFLKSRKSTMEIPLIIFSTLDELKDKFWANNAGADIYIEKSMDNLQHLRDTLAEFFSKPSNVDFAAIEREARKISDDSIIEMVNGLLDNKLFQSTIIGMLTELSSEASSLDAVTKGIFDLLRTVCEAEIVEILIRSGKSTVYMYVSNFAGFSENTVADFSNVCMSDFNSNLSDFKATAKKGENFLPAGNNPKKIISYTAFPLSIGGGVFASVHIGNSINDYFSPGILENITVFLVAATPIIANALAMLELNELQKNTRTAFARYVPADVMDEIIEESSRNVKQSESRNTTVLFSDIRDFTTISENTDVQDVVEFLNSYFYKLGNEIISEDGYIDKFIGDAIMAVFGITGENSENHQICAVKAAIKMLASIKNINTSKITMPKGHLQIGIGINCGKCILGNIGFKNKMDYTVIGDTVNLASRIEKITKLYRHPLIVSEYVYDDIKNHFLFRKIDNVRVKGKEKPVGIYAVHTGFTTEKTFKSRSGEVVDVPYVESLLIDKDTFTNYSKGLQMFYMNEWKTAGEYFSKALETSKDDYLSMLYAQRAMEFAKKAPPENWKSEPVLLVE